MPSADRPAGAGAGGPRRLFAVIPAHNEAATVREVVEATLAQVDRVIVVDDGSTDGTAAAVAGTGAEVVRLDRNRGKGDALLAGMARAFGAGAAAVVTLDADRQHDPDAIPAFRDAAAAASGALVLGDRSAGFGSMAPNRALGIAFGSFFITWASGRRIRDAQCGMRLYPRTVWERVRVPPREVTGFRFETAVLVHAGAAGIPFVTVPVAVRSEGYVVRPSHFHPVRDFLRIFGLVAVLLLRRRLHPRGLLIALGFLR